VSELVLSLFPGIGILDRAFEEEGFCVVRGPDLLWGGDIKRFHPPKGRFEGVIGGSPCQCFSQLAHLVRHNGYEPGENLVPEFERVVAEAAPAWFVMENVIQAPIPSVAGYVVDPSLLDARWLGEKQSRMHRFSFGSHAGLRLHYQTTVFEAIDFERRVLAKHDALPRLRRARDGSLKQRNKPNTPRTIPEALELQGLPRDFFEESPFTVAMQRRMLGNAVPMSMGPALAGAIRTALERAP
jgi:DNA (cytosine-5)-methyltransferase 1